MTDYYEHCVSSLQELLRVFSGDRRCVYRGQRRAEWELVCNLFRGNPDDEEIDLRFRKTKMFVSWCKRNSRLLPYNNNQLLYIAQHYGLSTDLLDFSESIYVAAFFALGAPKRGTVVKESSAAIFVLNREDFGRIGELADVKNVKSVLPQIAEFTGKYQHSFRAETVAGLSRIVAQEGVFVQDVVGSLESMSDGRVSVVPMIYEEEFGRPFPLVKYTFTPHEGDLELLAECDCTYDRVFPPPNDLERETSRFFDMYSELAYAERREQNDRRVIYIGRCMMTTQSTDEGWDSTTWEIWKSLNLDTSSARRSDSRELEFWDVPSSEIYDDNPSPRLSQYIDIALKEEQNFRSRFELVVICPSGDMNVPIQYQQLIETLMGLPYAANLLELTLRMSLRLFLETKAVEPYSKITGANDGELEILRRVFGQHERFNEVDLICFDDKHCIRAVVPLDAIAKTELAREAVVAFKQSDIGKQYVNIEDTLYGVYCMMFHRPRFRALMKPEQALAFWANYVIPWQARFGQWKSAILNPFHVEYTGLS